MKLPTLTLALSVGRPFLLFLAPLLVCGCAPAKTNGGSGGASPGSGGASRGTGGVGGGGGGNGGSNPDGGIDAPLDGRDATTGSPDATAERSDANPADLADAAMDGEDPNAIDVYLIGGQSNATGQGYLVNLPVPFVIDTRVMLFHSGAPHLNSGAAANMWIPLRQASESPDRFGPELGFGNHIHELYPGRKIAVIKHAHTGTSLFADWVPGATATNRVDWGPQFAVFVDTVALGLQGLRDQGLHPVIRAMLWQQGENDADTNGAPAQQYGANLGAFIRRVHQQWSVPDMLFIYGFVYPPPNVGAGRDQVRQGEANVDQDSGNALAVPGAFVIPTDDLEQRAADPNSPLPNDHVHFGTAGQLELGRRMADKIFAKLPP